MAYDRLTINNIAFRERSKLLSYCRDGANYIYPLALVCVQMEWEPVMADFLKQRDMDNAKELEMVKILVTRLTNNITGLRTAKAYEVAWFLVNTGTVTWSSLFDECWPPIKVAQND